MITLFASLPAVAQNVVTTKISFDLSFPEGSNILEINYLENRKVLANLNEFIKYNKFDIHNDYSHLVIVSYIKTSQKDDLYSLNRSSILASVVRSYLKIKYGLENDNFTFIIRTDNEIEDIVKIEYKPYPIHPTENQDIHYTLNTSYNYLIASISKYREIPFDKKQYYQFFDNQYNSYNIKQPKSELDISNPVFDVKDQSVVTECRQAEYKPITQGEVASSAIQNNEPVKKLTNEPAKKLTNEPAQELIQEPAKASEKPKPDFNPVFGIKTNLMNLGGFIPSSNNAKSLYNIAFEFYYCKRFSISAQGFIAPLLSSDKVSLDDSWRVSGFGIENRIWLGRQNLYNGFYAGLYAHMGDFDIRDITVSDKGNTGNFYGGGISFGFSQSIIKHLSLELGLRGGYRYATGDKYVIYDGRFYKNESFENGRFELLDYNLSFVYRF